MGPKRRQSTRAKRGALSIGRKPSPRKISPPKSVSTSLPSRALERVSGGRDRPMPGTLSPEILRTESVPSTPVSKKPVHGSPRSNERYNLREITPPSYITKTPLRTPAGIIRRTPARVLGRTPKRTPFKTPQFKPLAREPILNTSQIYKKNKDDAQKWKKHLREVTGKNYKLCNLSTMSNFKYQNSRLRKKYESHLKNKVLEVFPSPLVTVSLTTTSCLTLKPNVVDAVRIEICSLVMGKNEKEDEMASVYYAWLFHTTEVQSLPLPDLEWFPVMLYSGRDLIHNAVIDWLQGSFGCYVAKQGIRPSDMLWIAGIWSGYRCSLKSHSSDYSKNIHLTYRLELPDGFVEYPDLKARGRPMFKFSLASKDVHHVWDCIVDTSSGRMTKEQLDEYFSTMFSLVKKVTLIPSYLMTLHLLQTPCMRLSSDGTVNVSCINSVGIMVRHLIDIFLQMSYFSREPLESSGEEEEEEEEVRETEESEET